jgi:hypothetical protein
MPSTRHTETEGWSGAFRTLIICKSVVGRAIAQAVILLLSTAAPRVRARSGHVEFVVNKVALGQVSSEFFRLPCQYSSSTMRASKTGEIAADISSELSLTPPQETKKKVCGSGL